MDAGWLPRYDRGRHDLLRRWHGRALPGENPMRLTIQRKVFIATFVLAVVMTLLALLLVRRNLEQGFGRYVASAELGRLDRVVERLQAGYVEHGGWGYLGDDLEAWRRIGRPADAGAAPPPPAPPGAGGARSLDGRVPLPGRLPPHDTLGMGPRLALLDAEGRTMAGRAPGVGAAAAERPIYVDGRLVGRLTLRATETAASALDAAFLASQRRNLQLSFFAALGLSLLAAWLVSRQLLRPIRDLASGAREIANGRLGARIPVRQDDELGALAADFNEMAARLERADETRRAWVSDASHELRTPLAVLRAQLEAMQDGLRPTDPQAVCRLHAQVLKLSKLVDDLRLTLEPDLISTLACEPVDAVAALAEAVDAFRSRFDEAALQVETFLAPSPARVRADAGRLQQVFANLLENSLRYTHRGGRVRVSASASRGWLLLQLDDTAPAPAAAELPRLFDRFYRAEPSRSRAHGGSGLGLAICRAIVAAHRGKISARASELGGLCVRVELPTEGATP